MRPSSEALFYGDVNLLMSLFCMPFKAIGVFNWLKKGILNHRYGKDLNGRTFFVGQNPEGSSRYEEVLSTSFTATEPLLLVILSS
jgi:hypothetical protein